MAFLAVGPAKVALYRKHAALKSYYSHESAVALVELDLGRIHVEQTWDECDTMTF